jgi:hypothetical protein
LDKKRKSLLEKLRPYAEGFVLGGGTALAMQLTHRKSFDFDFFSLSKIPKNLIEKLSQTIPIANVSTDTSDELTFFTKDGIKVTFLNYPYKHAFGLEGFANGLNLFSVKDIAIQKAYTIGRRGEYRDYFDLYAILKNNYISLREAILEAKKIYSGAFDEKMFLEQLVYFEDLLNFDIIQTQKPQVKPAQVKRFFEEQVGAYTEKRLQ